jgi:hypothetical protein
VLWSIAQDLHTNSIQKSPALCDIERDHGPALCGIARNHSPVLCHIAQDQHIFANFSEYKTEVDKMLGRSSVA